MASKFRTAGTSVIFINFVRHLLNSLQLLSLEQKSMVTIKKNIQWLKILLLLMQIQKELNVLIIQLNKVFKDLYLQLQKFQLKNKKNCITFQRIIRMIAQGEVDQLRIQILEHAQQKLLQMKNKSQEVTQYGSAIFDAETIGKDQQMKIQKNLNQLN
ncbi:unnamed protein product [Paramecium sonneborni]|uniref:Uncharacterized protein n=1 Tax=Paramecium sonneborni TaxID=65129 RepID=A0A8S1PX64_9CILI|nr:unnamed protein product [Paramecium sonneborni]